MQQGARPAVRRPLVHAVLVLLLVISAGPATLGSGPTHRSMAVAVVTPSPPPSASPTLATTPVPTVDPRPAPLSLDMAVGQMMAASFGGPSVTDGLRHLILDQKVGTAPILRDNLPVPHSLRRPTSL